MKIITKSEEETMEFAGRVARAVPNIAIITLSGDLGAGKTVFVRGFARAIGIRENITSPTFTIMNNYFGQRELFHFDMYRLSSRDELVELGLEEYLDKLTLRGISIIEWPELIGFLGGDIKITVNKRNENQREWNLETKDIGFLKEI